MVHAMPSYYDSIGLLAICDAIDSVDGVPFHPEDPMDLSEDDAQRNKVSTQFPDLTVPALHHTLLSHIPVTGVLSPVGSIPYGEQQRVVYSQLANAGQLPQNVPPHAIGGIRPNVPVAHNLHGNNPRRKSSAVAQTALEGKPASGNVPTNAGGFGNASSTGPSGLSGPSGAPSGAPSAPNAPSGAPNGGPIAASSGPIAASPGPINSPMPTYRDPASPSLSRAGSGAPNTPLPSYHAGATAGSPPNEMDLKRMPMRADMSMPPERPLGLSSGPGISGGMSSGISNGMPSGLPNGMPSGLSGGLSNASPVHAPSASPGLDDSRATTPASPADSSAPVFRVEVCQICGRDFKGRKAATHKQQHIRRLHPAEYTPKRGGKKSRPDMP